MFRSGSRDDEPADANIITGLNSHTSREVNGLRRWRRTWCWRRSRRWRGVGVAWVGVGCGVVLGWWVSGGCVVCERLVLVLVSVLVWSCVVGVGVGVGWAAWSWWWRRRWSWRGRPSQKSIPH